jgi:hypothetical protein
VRGARAHICMAAECWPKFLCHSTTSTLYVLHVLDVCFHLHLHVFHLDVVYVAMTIHVCCKCKFQMFQLFQTYVASVLSGYCICCNGYTRMLQVYVSNVIAVSNVYYKCFIWMLHILRWPYTCCKCMFINDSFISDVCCSKCFMLQVLHD